MPFALGKAPATLTPGTCSTSAIRPRCSDRPRPTRNNLHLVEDWGMLGNDDFGDCVFAGADHETMVWLTESGHDVGGLFDEETALADYAAVTGFDPDDPDTDRGHERPRRAALPAPDGLVDRVGKRHKVFGFVGVAAGNQRSVMQAVHRPS